MIVYRITNTINEKAYVGATTRTLGRRWAEHVRRATAGSRCPLHCAIRKYGAGAFRRETLQVCETEEELMLAECRQIALAQTYTNGYNATRGGERGWWAEANAKRSDTLRRIGHGPSRTAMEKAWATNRSRVRSEEECQVRSRALSGRVLSPEHRDRISTAKRGRKRGPMPDASRAAISRGLTGRRLTPEHRAKCRDRGHRVTVDGIIYRSYSECARSLGMSHGNAIKYWVKIGAAKLVSA